LGTPNEQIWPGVTSLPDYKDAFPNFSPQPLSNAVPRLNDAGLDLLNACALSIVCGCLHGLNV
jgi:cyclin-dependent kinase